MSRAQHKEIWSISYPESTTQYKSSVSNTMYTMHRLTPYTTISMYIPMYYIFYIMKRARASAFYTFVVCRLQPTKFRNFEKTRASWPFVGGIGQIPARPRSELGQNLWTLRSPNFWTLSFVVFVVSPVAQRAARERWLLLFVDNSNRIL